MDLDFLNGLIAGLIAGWLIEWLIDWFLWRRDTEKLTEQLMAANDEIGRLQSELMTISNQSSQISTTSKDQLEHVRGINKAKVEIVGVNWSAEGTEGTMEKNIS
jgi:fructose-specific phosphotransferase system IIC component